MLLISFQCYTVHEINIFSDMNNLFFFCISLYRPTFTYTVNNQIQEPYFNGTVTMDIKQHKNLLYYMEKAVDEYRSIFTGSVDFVYICWYLILNSTLFTSFFLSFKSLALKWWPLFLSALLHLSPNNIFVGGGLVSFFFPILLEKIDTIF